jgi:hypothetical protein
MNGAVPLARRLNRFWTRLYTTGLGRDVRDERLAELHSDLWEHELEDRLDGVAPGSTATEMLIRLVSGMPADLAWRLEQRNPIKRSTHMLAVMKQNSWQRNGLWGLVFLFVGFLLLSGVGIAAFMEDSSLAAQLAYGGGVVLSGALILAGFLVTEQRPVLGAVMLVIGAVGGAALMWWFFFIPPLIALVVAAFGLNRARKFAVRSRIERDPPSGAAPA